MSFFDVLPEVPEDEEEAPHIAQWVQPDGNEIPVAVPLVRELGRAPGAMLSMQRADVYSAGVALILRLDLRFAPDLSEDQRTRLRRAVGSFGFGDDHGDVNSDLRIGVTLPGGATIDAFTRPDCAVDESPDGPMLSMLGGGGGGDNRSWTSEISAWLWPLPQPGTATLHFVYPRIGIPEGSVDIETDPLIAASGAVLSVPSRISAKP